MSILNQFIFTFFLFCLGLFGIILNRQNIIIILMSIELLLLSINLNFIYFSILIDDMIGQVFSLLILTVAAAESAIGLAIMIAFFKLSGNVNYTIKAKGKEVKDENGVTRIKLKYFRMNYHIPDGRIKLQVPGEYVYVGEYDNCGIYVRWCQKKKKKTTTHTKTLIIFLILQLVQWKKFSI